jgi:hypothetical protein
MEAPNVVPGSGRFACSRCECESYGIPAHGRASHRKGRAPWAHGPSWTLARLHVSGDAKSLTIRPEHRTHPIPCPGDPGYQPGIPRLVRFGVNSLVFYSGGKSKREREPQRLDQVGITWSPGRRTYSKKFEVFRPSANISCTSQA